ncbi:MAG: hypothetical protein QM687_08140 [Ferruginibacter sp.]
MKKLILILHSRQKRLCFTGTTEILPRLAGIALQLFFALFLLRSSAAHAQSGLASMAGIKIYFSKQPFGNDHEGSLAEFSSTDFIYGRIETDGKTIADAFKLDAQPSKDFHYLNYGILITPKGKTEQELNYDQNIKYVINNRSKPILVKAGDEKNTWLNFDVLPEPSRITTLQAPAELPENSNQFKFAAGMDLATREDNIRATFPANGAYTIKLVMWNYSFDDWGKPLESDKNIIAAGEFTYQFNAKDAATLIANAQKRLDGVRLAQMMKNKFTQLPDWWHGKPFTPADAILTAGKLTSMIRNYCSSNGLTYISHKVYPYNGASGWTIFRDNSGLPVSRRLNAEAWTLYKDENGRCRFAAVLIDENYAGGGTYGSPYISGLSGEFIDCSAIK